MATDAKAQAGMTRAEALAYNKGVEAVLAIARRSAATIAGTGRRRVYEDFAVAALGELAEAAGALLISIPEASHERTKP